MTHSPTCN